jgi:hypothetical protein
MSPEEFHQFQINGQPILTVLPNSPQPGATSVKALKNLYHPPRHFYASQSDFKEVQRGLLQGLAWSNPIVDRILKTHDFYATGVDARPPCTNVCCQPLQPVENNHMPLLAYEVAEMEQPINWVIEIISVLLAAVAAGFVVFVLGW